MLQASFCYHWAIKFIKKNEEAIIKYKVASILKKKNFSQFWTTIKKIRIRSISLPGIVDGKHTESDIADNFAEIYSNLYNSINDDRLQYMINKVHGAVSDVCILGKCHDSCHVITTEVVKRAISKLKRGKKDEIHFLSSNDIIEAQDILAPILSQLFSAILIHNCTDKDFNSSLIKPNPKNTLKSLSNSSNYRAISLNTVFSKLLDYVLIIILEDQLNSNPLQFAYKSEYSTSLCTFMVLETIQYYRSRGSNVYALLLDATKAFDRVKYSKLFEVLLEKKICPLIVRLLMGMYLLNSAKVKWNNALSYEFPLNNGVKQGGELSPTLFSLYLIPC